MSETAKNVKILRHLVQQILSATSNFALMTTIYLHLVPNVLTDFHIFRIPHMLKQEKILILTSDPLPPTPLNTTEMSLNMQNQQNLML